MKRDNRGLSLVEMIIVLAVLAVLAGAFGLGISMVSGRPADECASKLRSAIKNSRITTMGRQATGLALYMDADGSIMLKQTVDGSEQIIRIGDRGVTVEYKVTGDTAYRPLGGEGSPLLISFDRSSGAFETLDHMGSDYVGKHCVEIRVSKGNRTRILTLFSLTGKITME